MRKKRLLLIAVPSALAALLVWICYPTDYDHLKPTRLGTVSIPDLQIAVSLHCKSQPRAGVIAPYEGEYRILEIAERGKPSLYYDLPDTIPADTCHFEVFWYPTNRLMRFHDSGLTFDSQFRSESILNLEKRTLYSVVRHQDGVYLAKLSTAKSELNFPKRGEKSRVSGASSIATSTSTDQPDPVVVITIGREVAEPVDAAWTKVSGLHAGTIAPKQSQ
ncbi:MAG: hypothetical protein U1F83_20240 [Verrucomicrobiota bacterium]